MLGGPLSQAYTSEEGAHLPRSALPSTTCPGQRARQHRARGVWEHWISACPAHRLLPSTVPRVCLPLTQTSPEQAEALLHPALGDLLLYVH